MLKVRDKGRLVPFLLRPAQLKLNAVLEQQRAERKPMGAVVLKARKLGVSTMAQGLLIQRTTLTPLHSANVVAHNAQTAGAIMQIAELMYANLPEIEDPELVIRPPIANRRRLKELRFGEPDDFSLNGSRTFGANQSSYTVDTAKEFEGGRGLTLQSFHGSEVAFWTDLKRKLTTVSNAIDFTDPNTLTIYESTANGHNEFKDLCDRAAAGEGEFPLVFLSWFDDPRYRRPLTAKDQRAFQIGEHAFGEEEGELIVRYQLEPEQLNWRRWAIDALCQGDVNVFHQEYPSFPDEAFLASGATVFGGVLIQKAIRDAKEAPEPEHVTLKASGQTERKTRRGTIEVPTAVSALGGGGPWEMWARPSETGQYVIACDPATGEEDTEASFAIVVIDHETRAQVAQFEAQIEPDLIAEQIYLACLYYAKHRRPWLAIERTGGYGLSLIDTIFHEYGWRQFYTRRKVESATGSYVDRLGWDTNRQTKGLLHEEAMALLREGTHGVRSVRLARQMETYVRKGSGRTGPLPGTRSDLLLAWMIAQTVASEKAPRVSKDRKPVKPRKVRYAVTGY